MVTSCYLFIYMVHKYLGGVTCHTVSHLTVLLRGLFLTGGKIMRHTLGDRPKFSRLTRVKILSGDKIAPMRDFRLLSGSFIIEIVLSPWIFCPRTNYTFVPTCGEDCPTIPDRPSQVLLVSATVYSTVATVAR